MFAASDFFILLVKVYFPTLGKILLFLNFFNIYKKSNNKGYNHPIIGTKYPSGKKDVV